MFEASNTSCFRDWARGIVLTIAAATLPQVAPAQEASPAANNQLDAIEERLAERYDRLEMLAARLAELSGSTQPRRAELLRQLVARGRERNVPGQFDEIIAALADESYSTAVDGQARLQADLEKLLELLLQEDRDRQLESQRKRVTRYLQEMNRLLRLQRGVKARTSGGDDAADLADDQQRVADDADGLHEKIEEDRSATEGDARKGEVNGGSGEESPGDDARPSAAEPGESGEPADGEQQSGEQPSGDPAAGGQQSGDQSAGGPQPGGQPSGEESSGESGEPSESSTPQGTPMQRAADRLRRAQQGMKDAKEKLDSAKRDGAVQDQERAVEELELAKAELERILRQLREEELERMLVLLEARFRKMLDEQIEVYEETKRLDEAAANAPEHELEIAAGRLSRSERLIVRDADRALVLLREDGTSVAFPEAVEQARDDMQQIADRLNRVKVDILTQGLEEDVIAALEETLAALRQALDQLRDQRSQPQQASSGSPGEQPLVDQLAELRMIRALQVRINRRTEQYGALIEGEQAQESELLTLLDELALRQSRVFQATRDIETGSNR